MRKTRNEKDIDILYEMYRRAFAASTPKGDFDELLANAETNEHGQKVIPFMDYECEMSAMEKIIEDVLVEYKVPQHKYQSFRGSFMLGCSPKTKNKNMKTEVLEIIGK